MLQPVKAAFRRTCHLVSPDLYETIKRWKLGDNYVYPGYFDRTRSIFVHVPKAAGTSIAVALYGEQLPHHPWCYWAELNPRKFREYFKFAVVRNPISRFNSAFYFLKKGGMNEGDKLTGQRLLGHCATPSELACKLADPEFKAQTLAWWHFRPQADFVANRLGASMMDLLIRMENLDAGYARVCAKLGIPPDPLPRLNQTADVPKAELTAEAVCILKRLYRKDFDLWEKQAS